MPRYTDAQRRKGLATRRRNARQRRKEIEKLGYNPYNPTVKLGNGVSVTRAVEERLWRKAQSTIPTGAAMIVIWVFVWLFISEFGFWLPILAVILTVVLAYLNAEVVKKQTEQLAKERKIRLDEMKRFYTSPEWLLIRKQVIREEGNICSKCKKQILNKEDVTVDHKLPRSKYPDLALDRKNLCVLCRSCNSIKGDSDSEIFAAEIE